MSTSADVVAIVLVVLASLTLGSLGLRLSRTTSDFYVASRTVSPRWNGSAIAGEYLSGASFLGIAGLVLAFGVDMLWYPVGYTAGYLVLLALVAAPLRRSGAYTLPDFAEGRMRSRAVRLTASVLVVGVGWLYLLPQLQAAGLTLRTTTDLPIWAGAAVVAAVVTVNVMAGGMRSITFVQAFQYWLKLVALLVPAAFALLAWRGRGSPALAPHAAPRFPRTTAVSVQTDVRVREARAVRVIARGVLDGRSYAGRPLLLTPGTHQISRGSQLTFPAGAPVPHVTSIPALRGDLWALPLSSGGSQSHPLYVVYALIIATFLGTMGLPHVVVRFYTNPDGHAARRTTLTVLGLLGVFYLLPPVFGALGRLYTPELLLTGNTDATVLLLPDRLVGGLGGTLLGALVTGGAFAAFLSTSSGVALSVTGVLSQDVLALRGLRGFRIAAAVATGVPLLLSLAVAQFPVATTVGLAFAVAASSFCPLLVLGIWWRKLTTVGAAAGLIAGGGAALTAVAITFAGGPVSGWPQTLLAWPAAWSVPLGFAVMIGVSLLTPGRRPAGVAAIMARLHVPEADAQASGPTRAATEPGPRISGP